MNVIKMSELSEKFDRREQIIKIYHKIERIMGRLTLILLVLMLLFPTNIKLYLNINFGTVHSTVSIFDTSSSKVSKDVKLASTNTLDKPTKSSKKDTNSSIPENDYAKFNTYKVTPDRVAFVNRFKEVAKVEEEKFGIPLEVTLAQALLESKQGKSYLFRKGKAAFGFKCNRKICKSDPDITSHCIRACDDDCQDRFLRFETVWDSFRYRSNAFINHKNKYGKNRYSHIPNVCKDDWECWINEIADAGYATDPKYKSKLKLIVNTMELYKY